MSVDPVPEKKSLLKNPTLYTGLALLIVLLYVCWIFFARWNENRLLNLRTKEENAQKQREQDRAALDQLGGKDLAIQMFYASPGSIRRGESLQLCYGVSNAKSIKLEPQDNPVWPSHSRCVDVSPKKDTTYTLTISDAAGKIQTQSVDVKVR
jgi:hypothetical protein